jgi:A2L zinc ribbon domain
MPKDCQVCGGSGTLWRDDDYYTCLRCEGDGWDTPLDGCCDCGKDHEEDVPTCSLAAAVPQVPQRRKALPRGLLRSGTSVGTRTLGTLHVDWREWCSPYTYYGDSRPSSEPQPQPQPHGIAGAEPLEQR